MEHNLDQSVNASIVFTSPKGHIASYFCRLEFDTTNNVVEYEPLLLGLELVRDMGIRVLVVVGDSNLVVKQVKNNFLVKNNRLKQYEHAIWDTTGLFDAFAISVVPREQNAHIDSLVVVAYTLQLSGSLVLGEFKMEVVFR